MCWVGGTWWGGVMAGDRWKYVVVLKRCGRCALSARARLAILEAPSLLCPCSTRCLPLLHAVSTPPPPLAVFLHISHTSASASFANSSSFMATLLALASARYSLLKATCSALSLMDR